MRSLADQTEHELGGRWSVLTRQKRDHVHLDRLLDELAFAEGVEQERVLHAIARLVFPHAFAEESVLWPVLRHELPDGEELTTLVEQEHQEVNDLWRRLEAEELSPEERHGLLRRLTEVLREDVRDEEDRLLPRLQSRLDRRRLARLGVAWEVVRRIAPTRPHPVVARRPPGNALAAVPLTVIDHARDLVEAGSRRAPDPLRGRLRAASAGLGRLGARVEWVPVLRRGETASTHVPG